MSVYLPSNGDEATSTRSHTAPHLLPSGCRSTPCLCTFHQTATRQCRTRYLRQVRVPQAPCLHGTSPTAPGLRGAWGYRKVWARVCERFGWLWPQARCLREISPTALAFHGGRRYRKVWAGVAGVWQVWVLLCCKRPVFVEPHPRPGIAWWVAIQEGVGRCSRCVAGVGAGGAASTLSLWSLTDSPGMAWCVAVRASVGIECCVGVRPAVRSSLKERKKERATPLGVS